MAKDDKLGAGIGGEDRLRRGRAELVSVREHHVEPVDPGLHQARKPGPNRAVLMHTDEETDRRIPWTRRLGVERSHSLRGVALTAWHHTAHHRAQLVLYIRLNCIVPPAHVD